MKRFLTGGLVIFGLFYCLRTYAQTDPAARQAELKQKLMTELKMTSTQADSIIAINKDFMPQRREIFQDQSLSQDDKMTKMKSITDEADKRIQPVLGDSLFVQYKDWRKKNMQQMMTRGGKPGGSN